MPPVGVPLFPRRSGPAVPAKERPLPFDAKRKRLPEGGRSQNQQQPQRSTAVAVLVSHPALCYHGSKQTHRSEFVEVTNYKKSREN